MTGLNVANLTAREAKILHILKIILRDGRNCWLCGYIVSSPLNQNPDNAKLKFHVVTIDHVVPVALGGSKKGLHNMKIAHFCCNNLRSNREVTDELRAECESNFLRKWHEVFDYNPAKR